MNAITLTGNLVDSPTKVIIQGSDTFLINFRMGNNELVRGESRVNGFFDVTVFNKQAEHLLNLKKGERVVVVGRIEHTTFETQDGKRSGRTKIIASEVGLSALFEPAYRADKPEEATPEEEPAAA